MERYFLGGNTAYGFRSFYDSELARMDNVILMKGAPGTGKSTLIKSVGAECAKRGLDHEIWYCSGDPESADGIYVKALGAAVVDATSPHPCEAALPVIRERIVDMAAAMDRAAVLPAKKEITELINVKKRCYSRAYDKLKSAFCHYMRSEEAYAKKADIVAVRRAAAAFALAETDCVSGGSQGRNAFSKAITPNGIVAFYDHLAGRRVYMLDGGEHAAHVFLAEAAKLIPGGTVLHHPLLPERMESVLWKGCALTADAGPFAAAADRIELEPGAAEDGEELALSRAEIKAAVAELAEAKLAHAEIERLHAVGMDFSVTEGIARKVREMIFG